MIDLKSVPVKAVRKRRECAWCGNWINQGEPAQYRVYVFDGLQRDWMHPECAAGMEACDDDLSEGFMPGDYPRGSSIAWDDLSEEAREKYNVVFLSPCVVYEKGLT